MYKDQTTVQKHTMETPARQPSATTLWLRKKEAECPGFTKAYRAKYVESKKRWREANRERELAKDRERSKDYRKRAPESVKQRAAQRSRDWHRKFYKEHTEEMREKRRQYHLENREKENERHRNYLKKRKEKLSNPDTDGPV